MTRSELEALVRRLGPDLAALPASWTVIGSGALMMLGLPLEVRDLCVEWLEANVPDRAGRVMSLVRQMRGGKDYDAEFGTRMRGSGPVAWTVGRRFELAASRNGFSRERMQLRTDLFSRPVRPGDQLSLF